MAEDIGEARSTLANGKGDANSTMEQDKIQRFMERVIDLVQDGNEADISSLMDDKKNATEIEAVSWDLVPKICEFITPEIGIEKPAVLGAASHVLFKLSEITNPKETLLVLLEQTECFAHDVRFENLLPCIQKCLLRLPSKRMYSLAISLETLYAHIQSIPLPKDHNLEGEERKLLEGDTNVSRINTVTRSILAFLAPFIEELSIENEDQKARESRAKDIQELIKFLIKLCHHPLAYLDMTEELENESKKSIEKFEVEPSNEDKDMFKSASREVAEIVMSLMMHLQPNFIKTISDLQNFNYMLGRKSKPKRKLKNLAESDMKDVVKDNVADNDDDIDDGYQVDGKVSMLGLSVFAYLAFGEELSLEYFPTIYTRQHLLQFCCEFVDTLLPGPERLLVLKGMKLFAILLLQMEPESVPATMMQYAKLTSVIDQVLEIMVTNQSKQIRGTAANVLPALMKAFDHRGRHQLIIYVLNKAQHSAVNGYITTLLKDEINASLKQPEPNEYFVGKNLEKLLKIVYLLPKGETTDIMAESERVMGALNLLRFLILQDCPKDNVSGIWDLVPKIQKEYLNVLYKGINISRAHYQLEIKKLNEGMKYSKKDKKKMEVDFNVGGNALPDLSLEQQRSAMNMAVTTFDMLESILSRVNEIINQQQRAASDGGRVALVPEEGATAPAAPPSDDKKT